jgi:radical SAM protein with 4Fe4S-binding SPASM domain
MGEQSGRPGHSGHPYEAASADHGHPGPGGTNWPRLVFWETTAGCNLECSHCRRLDVSRSLMKNDLSTEEGKRLIDQLAAEGKPLLILSGGEPLMRPDIFHLADYAHRLGMPVALATNGTLIDPRTAQKIAAVGIRRVSISIDGADAKTHDEFRRIPGSFDKALVGIANVRAAGVPVQINMTLAHHNARQLAQLFELTERVGAMALHVFALVPVGCGVEIAEHEMLSPEESEEVLVRFYELSKGSRLETRATCAPQYSRIARTRAAADRQSGALAGEAPDPGRGCLAGTGVCFVSHDGKVFPCGYLPVEAGDVRRQSFGEIWHGSRVFNRLRNLEELTGKCRHCEFVRVCMGCRARAYSQTGDFMSEEPSCPYVPRHQ